MPVGLRTLPGIGEIDQDVLIHPMALARPVPERKSRGIRIGTPLENEMILSTKSLRS